MNKEKQAIVEKINSRFGLAAIGIFIIAAFFGITNTEPAKMINLWQAKYLQGVYFKYFSIFVIALVSFIPMILVRVFVIYTHNKKYANQPEMQLPYFKKL